MERGIKYKDVNEPSVSRSKFFSSRTSMITLWCLASRLLIKYPRFQSSKDKANLRRSVDSLFSVFKNNWYRSYIFNLSFINKFIQYTHIIHFNTNFIQLLWMYRHSNLHLSYTPTNLLYFYLLSSNLWNYQLCSIQEYFLANWLNISHVN